MVQQKASLRLIPQSSTSRRAVRGVKIWIFLAMCCCSCDKQVNSHTQLAILLVTKTEQVSYRASDCVPEKHMTFSDRGWERLGGRSVCPAELIQLVCLSNSDSKTYYLSCDTYNGGAFVRIALMLIRR